VLEDVVRGDHVKTITAPLGLKLLQSAIEDRNALAPRDLGSMSARFDALHVSAEFPADPKEVATAAPEIENLLPDRQGDVPELSEPPRACDDMEVVLRRPVLIVVRLVFGIVIAVQHLRSGLRVHETMPAVTALENGPNDAVRASSIREPVEPQRDVGRFANRAVIESRHTAFQTCRFFDEAKPTCARGVAWRSWTRVS
jgi:hypothetical protein